MKPLYRYLLAYLRFFLLSFLITFSLFSQAFVQKPVAVIADNSVQHKKRLWNLKDVDIRTFIKAVSEETKKDFVIDPRVTGKVTFISSRSLDTDELYQAFLATLQVNGFVALPAGSLIKIVPDYIAKGLSSPIYNVMMKKDSDAMAVSVVDLQYVPANELAIALKQFLTSSGNIVAYAPTNVLIVADRAGNIAHLTRIVHRIDQQRANKIEVIRLHNAQAKSVVETLKSLEERQNTNTLQPQTTPSIAADDRTNSILINGGSPDQRSQLRSVIVGLDSSNSTPGSLTEVIYLKHLNAERVATIVNAMIQNYLGKGVSTSNQASPSSSSNSNSESSQNTVSSLFNTTMQGSQNTNPSTLYSTQSGYYTSNTPDNDISSIIGKKSKSGSVSPAVQWEESTNSLIVTGPRDLLRKIRSVIGKIDIRRPQVLIEAVIAEVSVDREKELGIELNPGGKVQFLTRFQPLLPLSMIGNDGQLATQAGPDTTGQGLSLTFNGNQIRLLVRALETDNESNVIATPNLVTLDNEPAQIKVGSKISFATAQIQNNPTGGNPFNFYDREDVGLVLTINPQITPHGAIKLLIQQELSAVIPNTASAGNNPNTTDRFVRTTVMADNGQILVLGGLLQNELDESTSKVPFLGNIPGFGVLFKDHAKSFKKTNLMIFLKPTILYNENDDIRVSGGKYEFLRQTELNHGRDRPSKYAYGAPVLPIAGNEIELPPPFPMASIPATATRRRPMVGEG